jgi:hypothetical protein
MEPVARIRAKSLDALEIELREFQKRYEEEPARRRELRDEVIRAKDRARFASRNRKASDEKRREKAEMLRWMLVWLDDPAIFGDWVVLRRAQL